MHLFLVLINFTFSLLLTRVHGENISSAKLDNYVNEKDTIIIKARVPDFAVSSRSKREMGKEETCGQIQIKASYYYGKRFASFLKNLVTGKTFKRKIASVGELPWMAALIVKKRGEVFYCGGSIIDHWHILTSASCVAKMDADDISRLKVILGVHDIYNPFESGRIDMSVSQVAFHKGFDSIDMENNIALVKLVKPIKYSNLIQPICLPNITSLTLDRGNELAIVSGWGQMLFDPLKFLNKLDLRTWDNKKCTKRYENKTGGAVYFPKIRDDNICAATSITLTRSNSLCQGNNGSPLIMQHGGRYELIGITSWGIGAEGYPCVFTRVDKFVPWIRRNIKNNMKVALLQK